MSVEVNWIAVIAATVSAMVVGFIWYAPSVFGNTWMALAKLDKTKQGKGVVSSMLAAVIGSLLTAYILAHVSYLAHAFFKNSFFMDSVNTAFWLALGIAATTLAIHNSFEQKPWKLTAIAIGNRFVTLIVMGAVIGLLKP
jgi:uncharacterized membrane protein YeaQ/YmgE (transglycosylase-associated protein family)